MSTDKDTIIELRRRIDYLIKEIDDLRFTCREQANELTRLKVGYKSVIYIKAKRFVHWILLWMNGWR